MIFEIPSRHKTGVGVFTMQGFERRNKESKFLAVHFWIKNTMFLEIIYVGRMMNATLSMTTQKDSTHLLVI